MTSLATAAAAVPPPASLSRAEEELVLLETMKSLLDEAVRSLSGGEAWPLLEVSRQITITAQELTALSLQLGRLPLTAEAQQHRRRLLSDLSQQRAFCRSMLRRWRRSLMLRRQMLALQSEPVPYGDCLAANWR